MNERIKKLAIQAGFNLDNDPIDGHSFNHEIKKFAELIVKECISQCEQVVADTDTKSKVAFVTDAGRQFYVTDAGRRFYKGMWSGAKNCSEHIQEHFGVEE